MRKREGLSLVHSYLDGDGGGVGVGVGALEYQPIGGTPGRPPPGIQAHVFLLCLCSRCPGAKWPSPLVALDSDFPSTLA